MAVAVVVTAFVTRVYMLHRSQPPAPPFPGVSVSMMMPQTAIPKVDMQMGNELSHNSEGMNVLYADGHIIPTTQPYAGESRGTNSNAWLDNIYTVPTSNLASTGGVCNGQPFDDKDAVMLPTSH